MVEKSPDLSEITEVYRRSLVAPGSGSFYRIISADAPTKHGFNAHGVIFDELHVQKNRELYDVLHTSTGARRQPLEFLITTAGYDKHSICYELHQHALKVIDDPEFDPEFLAVIYAATDEDDWTDPATWRKANPNLGVSVKLEYLEAECKRAQEIPAYENTFRRLHLNQWTEQDVRWLQMAAWDLCNQPPEKEGLAVIGVDLASTADLTAAAVFWPKTNSVEMHFFCPEEGIIKRSKEDRVPYDAWRRQGLLTATEGNRTDYAFLRQRLNELRKRYRTNTVWLDRWNASHLSNELQDDGFEVVEVAASIGNMSAPSKELEAMITARTLKHGGHPILRWNASNVTVKTDTEGNIKPDKQKSGEKIDGVYALILAIAASKSARDGRSIYETQELMVV